MSFFVMDKFLFSFKGLDARLLGPISCLAVPSSAIGIRHSVKGSCASGWVFCYVTSFLRQRRIALPIKVILSHLRDECVTRPPSVKINERLQTCCSRLQYVPSVSTTCS